MKRIMRILAVVAVLVAVLCGGAALSDGHSFVQHPQSGSIDPETLSFHISWETEFVPLRVEVMHIEYVESTTTNFFGDTVKVMKEKPTRVYSITDGMRRGKTFDMYSMKADQKYRLFAYYGPGSEDYVSSELFGPDASELVFTTQPASGSYSPDSLKFEAYWVTNFKTVRLKIMKCSQVDKSEVWFGNYKFTDTYTEKTLYETVGTSLLSPAYAYSFEPEILNHYCVRTYYNKDDYVDSAQFTVTCSDMAFITQPQSGSYDPATDKFIVSWKTSFKPLKLQIVRCVDNHWDEKVKFGSRLLFTIRHTTVETTVEHSLTGYERQDSFAFEPAESNSEHDYAYYRLRAFYTDDQYIESDSFTADHSAYRFIASPGDAELDGLTGKASIGWSLNFPPRKVQVISASLWKDDYLQVMHTFNSPPQSHVGLSFPAEPRECFLRAFYGTGEEDYITSEHFIITDPGYRFTQTPENAVLKPDQTIWDVQWRTSFTPLRTVILQNPDSENPVKVYDSASGTGFALPVEGLDSAVYLLVDYHATEGYNDHMLLPPLSVLYNRACFFREAEQKTPRVVAPLCAS